MLGDGKRIYLACGATDLRKSIDALSAIARESFHLDPYSDTIFVFCNRNRDIVKILEWDGDGFWLHMKADCSRSRTRRASRFARRKSLTCPPSW